MHYAVRPSQDDALMRAHVMTHPGMSNLASENRVSS